MSEAVIGVKDTALALPKSAPLVRITAGLGSAGQKTWNLRRPVTLIGSRRPAHIVLHDRDINKAHCVIVNTGADVLIKDLHTASGTMVNGEKVDLAVLKDGDLINVGETQMQLAIQVPEDNSDDSGAGMHYFDPLHFPRPVAIRLLRTDKIWAIEQAVAMIGRLEQAAIRLDHEDVSHRHGVLFKLQDKACVFDLASRNGVFVNGQRCAIAMLGKQDTITVGPFGLSVTGADGGLSAAASAATTPSQQESGAGASTPAMRPSAAAAPPASAADSLQAATSAAGRPSSVNGTAVSARSGAASNKDAAGNVGTADRVNLESATNGHNAAAPASAARSNGASSGNGVTNANGTSGAEKPLFPGMASLPDDSALRRRLTDVESELSALQGNINHAWEQLNGAVGSTTPGASAAEVEFSARVAELDARDAALRGRLHDVQRLHEEVLEREREVARMWAMIQQEQEALQAMGKTVAEQRDEAEKNLAEIKSRENALAQRWTRLRTAACPHCGKGLNLGQ